MRFLFRLIIILFILGAIAVFAVPMFVPADYVREQIEQTVKQQTGRNLTVTGETSFSVFPDIGVKLTQVRLSDPPTMGEGTMLTIDALAVNLRLLPLLSQQIEVKQFVLDRPVFDLRVDQAGRRNWDFAAADGGDRRAQAHPKRARRMILAQAGGVSAASLNDLRLGDVRIIDGTVKYSDAGSGLSQQVDAVNVKLALERLSEPLTADGTFDWQREQVAFNGVLASPQNLLGDKASDVKLTLNSAHVAGAFQGEARLGETPQAAGAFTGTSPSVRNLAAWLGSPLPTPGGFGAAELKSRIAATPQAVVLSDLQLAMDGMTGEGQATLRLAGAKPHLRTDAGAR